MNTKGLRSNNLSDAAIALGCARYVADQLQGEIERLRKEIEGLRAQVSELEWSEASLRVELERVRELAQQRGIQRDALLDAQRLTEFEELFGQTWEQYVEGYIEDHRSFPEDEE